MYSAIGTYFVQLLALIVFSYWHLLCSAISTSLGISLKLSIEGPKIIATTLFVIIYPGATLIGNL